MMTEEENSTTAPRHFVLIQGACPGAWCWYKLVSLLESDGHKVTALDLCASGQNQVPLDKLHTIDDYHQPLYSYLESLRSDEKEWRCSDDNGIVARSPIGAL
ncbi:hypothetical protein M9H77_15736 [Catharanthus roseus]|uniref:Uncharacterized protein n=1 Tax=Catharanthus roseus TaxID=4058 RepID=A0ACC0B0K7_CATRO|nr:hypothetical protein M9H77_15736 [Catharanthus roseus]